MRNHQLFRFTHSSVRKTSRARGYSLIGLGTIVMTGLAGLLLPVQAQPAGSAVGTPVSPDYRGLKTSNSYQPLPNHVTSNTPPAVHVMPISDDLRASYRINPFYKKTLTS